MIIRVRRIEINHIFHAMWRNSREYSFDVLSVRINQANTLTILDVLNNHIEHQHRFTSAGLSKKIHMLASVFTLNAKKIIFVPISGNTEISDFFIKWDLRVFHSQIIATNDGYKQARLFNKRFYLFSPEPLKSELCIGLTMAGGVISITPNCFS